MSIIRYVLTFSIASSSLAFAADSPISHFLKPGLGPNGVPTEVFPEGAFVLGGRSDVWPGAPDFLLRMDKQFAAWPLSDDGTPKLYARSVVITDIGDTPDLALRRAGPDDAAPNSDPAPVPAGTDIANLYWQAWGGRCASDAHDYGFYSGCDNLGRNASIFARTVGEQTGTSRAGNLYLATTPEGNPGKPIPRIAITSEGEILVNPNQKPITFKLSRPTRDGETALLTSYEMNGKIRLDRVEVGAPDSCGKGFRCLRISN